MTEVDAGTGASNSGADGLHYDPYDYAVDAEPHVVWRRLRDEAPLYRNDRYDFFALSRYDDVLAGLLDTETFLSGHGTVLELIRDEPYPLPMMIMRDPPVHTRLRALAARTFTPRAVRGLEGRIRRICAEYLDPHAGSASFDFVDDFAALLPPRVILALLGFPEGFEREWREQIDSTMHVESDMGRADQPLIDSEGRISGGVGEALPGLLARRRDDPGDDLISALVHAEYEGEDGRVRPLSTSEIHAYVGLVAGAGTETVARMLGFAAVLLARHPDQQTILRDDPSAIPNGIEEILRFEAPSPVQARYVSRDVELHGRVVPARSRMLLLNGSADRDERHFPDPDRFDVGRSIDRHLAFGYGAHFCLGAALARLEGRVALEEAFARFPLWQIDEDDLEWVHTSTVRGYHSVPVHFDG